MATKTKKKSESITSVLVEGQVFIVETRDGVEIGRTEIDQDVVGLVIRDHVEKAITKLFTDLDTVKKTKKPGKKK